MLVLRSLDYLSNVENFRSALTLIFVFCCIGVSTAQQVKEKIGKSVWLHDGVTICDTTISFIQKFDSSGRKWMEWQLYRDTNCVTIDTNWVLLDTLGRMIEMRTFTSINYYTYRDHRDPGKIVVVDKNDPGDSLILDYTFELDSTGNVIKKIQYQNGKPTVELHYEYLGELINTYVNGVMIYSEVLNDQGEYILKANYNYYTKNLTDRYIRLFDDKGNNHYYCHIRDSKLYKETTHEFDATGNEVLMNEYFPNDSIQIQTFFEYRYW